jgi:hypothetical protein
MPSKKKTSKKTATKATESKQEKFVRLAPKRVVRTINSMRSLRKLANRNSYEWTDEQANKILAAIAAEAKALQDALNSTEKAKDTVEFDL